MKTQGWIALIVIVLILIGGWFWWKGSHSGTAPVPPAASATSTATPAGNSSGSAYAPGNLLLGTDSSPALGTYLVGSNGMSLYTYANDTANVSNCAGSCATNWPPYTVADTGALANLEAGVAGTAGTITRADGALQVTYNGAPLYYYAADAKGGDTNGQGVGGVWFVAKP